MMTTKSSSGPLLQWLNAFPPYLIRLAAHRPGGKPLRNSDIMSRSGLSRKTVSRIGAARKWDGFDIRVVSAFMDACRFNPLATNRFNDYVKRSNLPHIRRSKYLSSIALRYGSDPPDQDPQEGPQEGGVLPHKGG